MLITIWLFNIAMENHQFSMETSLPTLMNARVYVNLLDGNHIKHMVDMVN